MRAFTTEQRDLLRGDSMKVRLLVTFFLDQGTYRFCDDVVDLTNGVNTYIGASALTEAVEIRSGRELSAEPITLICDGNRMAQYGVEDPARVLRDMMGYLFQQRRVDMAFGFMPVSSTSVSLTVPVAAMKINYCRLIDDEMSAEGDTSIQVPTKLEIVMDSLASRYNRATMRTRSHPDQLEISATDKFFSFVADSVNSERTIYWGKKAPNGASGAGVYGWGGSRIDAQRAFQSIGGSLA